MRRILTITLACGALAGTTASAQSVDCNVATDQASLNACVDQGFKAADQQLNVAYSNLISGLDQADAERLKRMQRAWIIYRDAACVFVGAPTRRGSIHSMIVSDCLTSLTTAQTDFLIGQSTCVEGDLSCVGR